MQSKPSREHALYAIISNPQDQNGGPPGLKARGLTASAVSQIIPRCSQLSVCNCVLVMIKERRLGEGNLFVFCARFSFTHPILPFISHEFTDIWHELLDWQGGSTGKGKMSTTKLGIS